MKIEPIATFQERLLRGMAIRNMRQVDLVEKTGIPKSAINHYAKGNNEPKSDRIYLLAKALNVTEQWLMGLDYPMERIDPARQAEEDALLIEKFRMLTQEQKELILNMMNQFLS